MPPIKQNQVIDKSVEKAFIDLNEAIKVTLKQLDLLLEDGKQIQSTFSNATGIKSYTEALQKLEKNRKEANTLTKQQIDLLKKEEALKQSVARTTAAQEKAIQAKNRTAEQERKIAERQTKQSAKLTGAYARQSKTLTLLRNRAKNLAITYGENSKQFLQAEKRVVSLDKKLKNLDARLGQSQRFVGKYEKALGGLKNILGAAGVVGGVQLFVRVLRSSLKITKEYEKSNAVLAGVLGKTVKETKLLQSESKRLGATTAFSASQVTELQTELARLGKSEDEIIASTEGIINATIALGSETGETASLVGSTLNAFQLGAEESSRVADVLTLSTQKSALSFEKLNTALPTVSGAAAAAGVSLETMVAQLGQAADRGLDASTAATSLRNIYITLAEKGITLEDALNKINTSQDKLSTATQLFGKRTAVTALALADTRDKTSELDTALQNAGGTAQKVADIQLKTLDGRLKLLNSAWEGFVLGVGDGETALGSFASGAVKFATNALIGLTNVGLNFKVAIEGIGDLSDKEFKQFLQVFHLNEKDVPIIKTLDELKAKYEALPPIITNVITLEENLRQELLSLGEKEEDINIILEKYLEILSEKEAADKENLKTEEEKTEAIIEEAAAITDLIKIQEELLKQAKEMPGATEEEVAARNIKIAAINEEISRLKELGKVQAPASVGSGGIDIVEDTKDTHEEILEEEDKFIEKYLDKWEEAERKKAEIKRQWTEFGFDQAQNIASTAFDIANMQRDAETEAEITAMQDRLNNEKLDQEQRDLIEKQIQAKEKKIRTEKAKADKKAAIIQAIINTAISIGKTAATVGFPAAIPLIAIAAAAGAIQIATISAQPIPKFDKGSKSLPDGIKEVAEKRPEIVKSKKGVELFTKPVILGDDYTGAEVISGAETAKILDNVTRQEINHNIINSSNPVQDAILANAFNSAFEKHSNRMINEMKRNRPIKYSELDKMKVTRNYIANHRV